MMCLFFTQSEMVEDYAQALTSDTELYSRYFWGMLKGGINLAPSQFEASFVSSAHSQEDISRTLEIAEGVLASLV